MLPFGHSAQLSSAGGSEVTGYTVGAVQPTVAATPTGCGSPMSPCGPIKAQSHRSSAISMPLPANGASYTVMEGTQLDGLSNQLIVPGRQASGRLCFQVGAVRPYWAAGFTDLALLQVGGQSLSLNEAANARCWPSCGPYPVQNLGEEQMMSNMLHGKKVAILAADGVERVEVEQPRAALVSVGAQTELLSLRSGEIQARDHGFVPVGAFIVDRTVARVFVDEFDALVLPGGAASVQRLRADRSAVCFVGDFVGSGKSVAAICHGPWLLAAAGVVAGRRLASYPSIHTDLRNDGAQVVDQEVVIDGNLISSRSPADLPAFCANIIDQLARRPVERPVGVDRFDRAHGRIGVVKSTPISEGMRR